nr:hypothetical protein BRARA_H01456 [Ipomoea batatas]
MAEAALLPSFLPYSFGDSTVSGRAASPSKYLITCLIVGRFSGELLEHTSPSLSRITASTSSMSSSGRAFCSMGRLPHTISRSSAPKANTSELVLGFPVLVSSGARYPNVPTTLVVPGFSPRSYSLASPKSPSFPFSSESNNTFPAFISLWITVCSHSSCKYNSPEPTPLMIFTLCSHVKTALGSSNKYLSKLPLGMKS